MNIRLPTSLRISDDKSIYLTSIQDNNTSLEYATRRYTEFEQDKTPYFANDSIPVFRAQEIIVRFKQNALDSLAFCPVFQGKRREFDLLQTYLSLSSMHQIDDKLKKFYKEWDKRTPNPLGMKALKVFKELTPNLTTTVNRLGDTIRVPDFWTTLLISFPEDLDFENVYTALNDLEGIIAYAEPNYFIEPTSLPNDFYFASNQESLHSEFYLYNPNDPNDTTRTPSINIKEAWEIYPEAGRPDIKCGVLDQRVDYTHEDFGYLPSYQYNSSKVIGGWDFHSHEKLYSSSDISSNNHGTQSAGIIGALRNNNIGIAGIAGGDDSNGLIPNNSNYYNDKGVSLFGLTIMKGIGNPLTPNPIIDVYDAIVTTTIDDTLDYTFGLNTMNNSWRIHSSQPWFIDTNFVLLKEAIRFTNRNNVSFVAARGNEGNNSLVYPAVIDDDWVLCVGGTGPNGRYKDKFNGFPAESASYGNNIDVSAPASSDIIKTTLNEDAYNSYSMTSAAAPHVTGLVTLLQSYINDTIQSYQNLAPEDCEQILQLTAENCENPGQYSDSIGWGKINAGKAMRLIEKPWNTIHHFGTSSIQQSTIKLEIESTSTPIYLKEQTQNYSGNWFQKGNYNANIIKVSAKLNHEIDDGDSLVNSWPRPSSSNVLEGLVNDSLLPRERIILDYLDRDSCITHGFIYELIDGSGNTIGWLPEDTTTLKPKFEYTLLSRDTLAPIANISDNTLKVKSNINLYPNPSYDKNLIVFDDNIPGITNIYLYDIRGRLIKKVYSDIVVKNTTVETDVSKLPSGVYLYSIINNTKKSNLKFIKY